MGRYGNDHLNLALMVVSLVFGLITFFTYGIGDLICSILQLMLLSVWMLRAFSRNIYKRSAENQWYLRKSYAVRNWFDKKKRMWKLKKTHKIFKCPTCSQKIKVPKGRGRIEIRCTKCGTKFIKRS